MLFNVQILTTLALISCANALKCYVNNPSPSSDNILAHPYVIAEGTQKGQACMAGKDKKYIYFYLLYSCIIDI